MDAQQINLDGFAVENAELGLTAMRSPYVRRPPSAVDAATAAAFGFCEIETTVPVLGDAPSDAVACLIGAAFGADGVLIQCSVEETLELGMRGLTSYSGDRLALWRRAGLHRR